MSTSRTKRPAAELVAAILSGDRQAEEDLVERYSRGVWIIVQEVLGDRPESEDFYQETFRVALEKLRSGEVREPEKLSGFLSALARNLAIGYLRREARRKTDVGLDPVEEMAEAGMGPLAFQPPESQLGRLLRKEKVPLVHRVLAELQSERDRQLLFRYYLAEEDKEQICEDLGLSSLHFNRVVHRARQRYRVLYEKAAGAGPEGSIALG